MLIDATDGMACVGAFPDCRDVVRHVAQSEPQVILMDIDMPHVDGVEGVTDEAVGVGREVVGVLPQVAPGLTQRRCPG